MSDAESPGASEHVVGEARWRRLPRVRTKPTTQLDDRRVDTGGGYERVRSKEVRPHTARDGSEDVYVSVHRLCAVAWCYDAATPIEDVLADLAGRDVHHTTGVEWANFGESPNFAEAGLEVVGHGRHSEMTATQSEMRAWAADAREVVETEQVTASSSPSSSCVRCGGEDACARVEGVEGVLCLECATAAGSSIEIVG